MDKEPKQEEPEVGEDTTQYGEFVSSYFAWIPLPSQKEKAKKMVNMTKKEKNDDIKLKRLLRFLMIYQWN